jgi:hypothetical protein
VSLTGTMVLPVEAADDVRRRLASALGAQVRQIGAAPNGEYVTTRTGAIGERCRQGHAGRRQRRASRAFRMASQVGGARDRDAIRWRADDLNRQRASEVAGLAAATIAATALRGSAVISLLSAPNGTAGR